MRQLPRSTVALERATRRICAILILAFLATTAGAKADLDSLANLIPADVFGAYTVDPAAGRQPRPGSNSLETATFLIDQAFSMGVLRPLDISIRGWLDAIAALSPVIACPHAVMLFDLQVERDDDESHKVSSLRAALVMKTGGDNKSMQARIQHLLKSYTDQNESTLSVIPADGYSYYRLQDQRLEDWLVFVWAEVGDYFVIAIGEESLRAVVDAIHQKRERVSELPTYREAVRALAAEQALIGLILRFDTIQSKSPLLGRKIVGVQTALGMKDSTMGFWAAGYDGKSLEIRQWLQRKGGSSKAVIAGQEHLQKSRWLLPAGAVTYAAFGIDPDEWFERIRMAYLAARSRRNAAASREYWKQVEHDAGLSFSQFFSNLDSSIIVHDYPPHALRLPPAWTIAVPIKGDSSAVQKGLDAILSYWQRQLAGSAPALKKTDDGLWCFHVGLEGPAIGVSKKHLLISFSPYAVRQNFEILDSARPKNLPNSSR